MPAGSFSKLSDSDIFVGRQAELEALAYWVSDSSARWLALRGPLGVGKSALLSRALAGIEDKFADGVVCLDLGVAGQLESFDNALAEGMGLSLAGGGDTLDQCAHFLRARRCLLVIDSAEADPDVPLRLRTLLKEAPGLRVLTSSRLDLEVSEARPLVLKPLESMPKPGANSEATEALSGFLRSLRGPSLAPADAQSLAALSEGIPAAIEVLARHLAAGGASPPRSAPLNFGSLPKGLRWALDPVWLSMSEGSRTHLKSLACFQGSFSSNDAAQVASESTEILEALQRRGLVQRPQAGHYQLPRWFRDALRLGGLDPQALGRHARLFAAKVEALCQPLRRGRQLVAAEEFSIFRADVLAAWDFALETRNTGLVRSMAPGLGQWLELKGRFQQGHTLYARAASALPSSAGRAMAMLRSIWFNHLVKTGPGAKEALKRANAEVQAHAPAEEAAFLALSLSSVAYDIGDLALARVEADRASESYRALKDPWGEAWATHRLGQLAELEGNTELASGRYLAAQEAFQLMGCLDGAAWCQFRRGCIYEKLGLAREAQTYLRESLRLFEKLRLHYFAALSIVRLAHVARAQAEEKEAVQVCEHGLRLFRDVRYDEGEAWCNFYLGDVAASRHQDEDARQHVEKALKLFKAMRHQDGMAWALVILTMLASRRGDAANARLLGTEGESTFRDLDSAEGQAACLRWMGLAEEKSGRHSLAEQAWKKALKLAVTSKILWRVVELAGDLGRVAEAHGDAERAAELLGLAAYDSHSPAEAREQGAEGLARLRVSLGADGVATASRRLLHQGMDKVLASAGVKG